MSNPLNMIPSDTWFSEGLRFKCTGCGQCCTGAPGYVWVTETEIAAIANYLNISIPEFHVKYLRLVGDRKSLLENPKTYDCIFLKDKKCQVYPVRPVQCQTFPWWVYNVQSEEHWNELMKECEGVNHPEGAIISAETICSEVQKHTQIIDD